jgi:striatin 1/3/4
MRFLQTEWHRHERDRNAWEIERQEMKGRIARLEGSTRKSDSSNKSLKKYINMLEDALKKRDEQVKALKAGNDVQLKESVKEGKAKENLAVKHQRRGFSREPVFQNSANND